MPPQAPAIGDDVTALMNAPEAPAIGADVTALMNAEPAGPDFRSSNELDASGKPVVNPDTQQADADWMQRAADSTEDFVSDILIGFGVKGPAQGAVNLGKLASNFPVLGRVLSSLNERLWGLTPEQQRAAFTEADKALEGTSLTQTIAKGAEQIAETVIPSNAIRKAGVAAASRLAPMVGRAAVAAPAVIEGAGAAGMAAVQGGDPTTAAAMGAAVPVLGRGASMVTDKLKKSATTQVQQALGGRKERYKAIAERLTPEILKRGLHGSHESLLKQSQDALEVAGSQIDEAITQYGSRTASPQSVIDALETTKNAFRTTTTMSVADALKKGYVSLKNGVAKPLRNAKLSDSGDEVVIDVVFDERPIGQLNKLQAVLSDLGDHARVDQLVALRRTWDKVVAQAGGYAHRAQGAIGVPLQDQSEAAAKREATSAIRALLDQEVPELTVLNKEFSFWKNLNDVVEQTVKRTTPQQGGLTRHVAEVAGAAAGSGGGVVGAVVMGKLSKAVYDAMASSRWRLMSAHFKDGLAASIAEGNTGKAFGMVSRLAAVQGSKVTVPSTSP